MTLISVSPDFFIFSLDFSLTTLEFPDFSTHIRVYLFHCRCVTTDMLSRLNVKDKARADYKSFSTKSRKNNHRRIHVKSLTGNGISILYYHAQNEKSHKNALFKHS